MTEAFKVAELAGDFAEDKDLAATLRNRHLRTAVEKKTEVVRDFSGVSLVTQSFVHV